MASKMREMRKAREVDRQVERQVEHPKMLIARKKVKEEKEMGVEVDLRETLKLVQVKKEDALSSKIGDGNVVTSKNVEKRALIEKMLSSIEDNQKEKTRRKRGKQNKRKGLL